ncbi:MAG: adenylate/guanylate cyclase domain-containing protein [Spirochaetaceae bacterium]|nr:MAG: adenylate/guanylate cyclase domain-containing protein [Spirochaetaceae bacterium]
MRNILGEQIQVAKQVERGEHRAEAVISIVRLLAAAGLLSAAVWTFIKGGQGFGLDMIIRTSGFVASVLLLVASLVGRSRMYKKTGTAGAIIRRYVSITFDAAFIGYGLYLGISAYLSDPMLVPVFMFVFAACAVVYFFMNAARASLYASIYASALFIVMFIVLTFLFPLLKTVYQRFLTLADIPVMLSTGLFVASVALSVILSDLGRRNVARALATERLGRIVGDSFTGEMLKNPKMLPGSQTAGKAAVVSIQIVNFQMLSDTMPSASLAKMLEQIGSIVRDRVFARHGIIASTAPNAISAVFGNEFRAGGSTTGAVRAAAEILSETNKLFINRTKAGKFIAQIGIGLHCGEVMVSGVGRDEWRDCVVLGTTAQLADLIVKLSKTIRAPLIISEAVYREQKSGLVFRRLGRATIKGFEKTLAVYAYYPGSMGLEPVVERK